MYRYFYECLLRIYYSAVFFASFFLPKAKKWILGQQLIKNNLKQSTNYHNKSVIWFHVASLGEYEQALPLVDDWASLHPDHTILISFFSPSGYDIIHPKKKEYEIVYLPLDLYVNAAKFIDTYNPKIALFIKYEIWYNYLSILKDKHIPYFFISTQFRRGQFYFNLFGKPFCNLLKQANRIFTPYKETKQWLELMGFENIKIAGDTRYDRVLSIAQKNDVKLFFDNEFPVLVAGSTWPPDEALLIELYRLMDGRINLIIAPHHIDTQNIERISLAFGSSALRYSTIDPSQLISRANILIIDNFGMLSRLYKVATYNYVGGGFGSGIHNILEPAIYGQPVFTGPRMNKFQEAQELRTIGQLITISDAIQLSHQLNLLTSQPELLAQIKNKSTLHFSNNCGGTAIILQSLEKIFCE